ncbi:MAG: DUF1800 family protein [Pseudomonadota bacterium]
MGLNAAIAVTRFGLGGTEGEIRTAEADPVGWLQRQLTPTAFGTFKDNGLLSAQEHVMAFFDHRVIRQQSRRSSAPPDMNPAGVASFGRHIRQTLIKEVSARSDFGSTTQAPFHERLTRFWANHFSVSSQKFQVAAMAGAYEREAIRPNILGSFADLAEAAIFHPAMLVYLDNWQSVGPNSRAGRRRDIGLNENLAREVLELHTVTPASGYTQDDVTEFARALTGWTLGNPRIASDQLGETLFLGLTHEPGSRTVLQKRYSDAGGEQARSIVRDLARHPATASHIATKLARHFVADAPPPALIDRLATAFLQSDGDLMALYNALLTAPEAWVRQQEKVKTPDDLLTSTSRMIGLTSVFAGEPRDVLESFAQLPFNAPSPEGWPDTKDAWIGPDSLNKRIEWARRVSSRQSSTDARDFLEQALGDLVSSETRQAVIRAESGTQGLTLALMSPEFQRR